jgi:FkbM family methyltransferase
VATYFWGPEKRLIVPTPELAFLMHDDESGRCQMHQVGVPELAIIQWAGQNFGNKAKKFIDCGAHMGAYSILLSEHFAEVHAFEAQRRTYFQLCGNIFINEKDNITAYNKAVTDPVGANQKADLTIVSEDGGGSTIRMTQPNTPVLNKERVETVTIDHYHLSDVGLIKLDIEGNELKALHGAHYTLERCGFPPIIFEANTDEWYAKEKEELFAHLASMNYQVAEIRPFNNMFVAVQQDANVEIRPYK